MKMNRRVSRSVLSVLAGLLVVFAAMAAAPADADDAVTARGLVDKARATFDDFMEDQGMTWLHEHLKDARGVLIVPQMLKGGFFLGASGGRGILLVRDEKSGEWSEPVFYNIGSVSFGLQIGASAAEMVMLVMSQKGVDTLLTTSVKLGGDISAAMGPTGAGAGAKGIRADIISFARAKGAYVGLSLEGAIVDVADSLNNAYYGKTASPSDILVKQEVKNPKSAELRDTLQKAAK